MVIVKLDGGMGNQLFQYAVGIYQAIRLDTELLLDTSVYTPHNNRQYELHHFNVEEAFCTSEQREKLRRKQFFRRQLNRLGIGAKAYWYTEQSPGYDAGTEKLTDDVYLEGFWQSERYFKPVEELIRLQFYVKDPPYQVNIELLAQINWFNSISIHVRRGDYVNNKETNEVHGVCSIDYYREAISRLSAEISEPRFYIFSDDIGWAKENLSAFLNSAVYIDHNQDAPYEDLRLMYTCKHHIIANSSFSWWGAWLGNNAKKKVIAPQKWFRTLENNDIIPNGWLAL